VTAFRRIIGVAALAAAVGVTWFAGIRLEAVVDTRPHGPLLYLPSGKYLRVMSLGHQAVLADAIYLWAIQYYSNYDRADRYQYVQHVFEGVITELDPYYIDAYWLGAMILIVEAQDVSAGLRLLDKGIENNPEQWILPYLAAWESYNAGLYERAERYFLRASKLPDAPMVVRRMRAGMRGKAGDVAGAIELWLAILNDPESEPRTLDIAERQVRTLRTTRDLNALRNAIEEFRMDNDRFPETLAELRSRGYVSSVPLESTIRAYRYDPSDGRLIRPDGRVLGHE
jgi:tetratricopeptide (TPR) repeat protein